MQSSDWPSVSYTHNSLNQNVWEGDINICGFKLLFSSSALENFMNVLFINSTIKKWVFPWAGTLLSEWGNCKLICQILALFCM